jgi:hypothetical protein
MKSLNPVSPIRRDTTHRAARAIALLLAALLPVVRSHAVQAPPHNISAANLSVIQNDTGNTVNSVAVSAPLSLNDMRVRPGSNRGDYNLQIGDSVSNNALGGILMVSIAQNGRDNGELADEQKNYAAPAFDGGPNGLWCVIQDLTTDRAEYNLNCSAAYFRTNDWLCGWFRNTNAVNGGSNTLYTGSPGMKVGSSTAITGYNFKWVKNGQFRVNLLDKGYDATTNPGVLLVNHAKNEGNYASSVANADGTWEIYIKDNFANNTSLEQDPAAFVFVPRTNTFVVSGKFGLDATGTNAEMLIFSGSTPAFSVTNFAVGRYRLTIPGASPEAGVLVLSSEGGKTSNFDNAVSYEPDGDGWIIESRDVGTFPPPLEATTNQPVASFVYIPAATAGVAVTPTNTLITAEFGLTATFNLQLDLAPTNDVTIALASGNPSEGIVSTDSVTFNATNWNVPQSITVTGQDDLQADGPVSYRILLAPIVSDDTRYNGLDPADVAVINVDDEQPGITVTPTQGLRTSESGGTATLAVFLNRQPAAEVVLGLSSDNPAEGTVAPASLTFTPANWSTPQTVTVTGVDDFRKDGTKTYHILSAAAVSPDLTYHGVNPADVTLVNADNDNPGMLWSYATPLTVAEGGTTSYSVGLATQPDSNVVVTVRSSDSTVGTVSPGLLTFTPLDWSTPKVVTVAGVDNLIADGTVLFSLSNVVSSTDPLYVDFAGAKVLSATRLDNETSLYLPSGDCVYGLGMPPIGIDGQGRLEDVDATNYDGGTLTVTLTANGNAADRLEIRNAGTNAGQIGVTNTEVLYEGNVIGTFTGGLNLTPLVVTLNTNSTLAAVQQLLRSVTFGTVTNVASLATRSASVALSDGLGGLAAASKAIRVGALRLTQYQEAGDYGYGAYSGAADIALSQVGHGTPWPLGRTQAPTEGLLIDWPDGGTPNESQVLLRFDEFVGTNYWQVPSNAIVVSAELLLRVNNTGDGGRFFRLLMPWDATNDTWDTLGEGIQTDDLEARSMYESQLGVEDGSGATGTRIVSVGVTPDVQAWVNGQTNYGWAMIGWPLRTDGTGFSPSDVTTVGDRPRLRVRWLEPGQASASFRQGVDGYTGTHDTNLRQATPDTGYYTDPTIWSDANDAGNTNATQCLLQFANLVGTGTNQIPPGSQIYAAFLDLASAAPDSMGDGGRFHGMLQPWDETTVTWNTLGGGVQTDGIMAASTPTVVAGNSGLDPDVQGTHNSFEVTTDVQAWVNGSRPNYGWAILPWPGGSNGWGNRSSKYVSLVDPLDPARDCPRLRVYYTASIYGLPATVQTLRPAPGQIQVRFTGTAGKTYTVLRAPTATGPWESAAALGTATVGEDGSATFTDAAPLATAAFYRVVYP